MNLRPELISEIIAMAWSDRAAFEDIKTLTGLREAQTIRLMRSQLKPSSFRVWRQRVSGRAAKHKQKQEKHAYQRGVVQAGLSG